MQVKLSLRLQVSIKDTNIIFLASLMRGNSIQRFPSLLSVDYLISINYILIVFSKQLLVEIHRLTMRGVETMNTSRHVNKINFYIWKIL